jgi:hypothetical protein
VKTALKGYSKDTAFSKLCAIRIWLSVAFLCESGGNVLNMSFFDTFVIYLMVLPLDGKGVSCEITEA